MRGFGDTDKPKEVEKYRLEYLVEELKLFIEALGTFLKVSLLARIFLNVKILIPLFYIYNVSLAF